ncbi:GNAT family N-acetyltransferase [Streptomyces sp. NPDC047082]|uniref:GNAT family N-acetyltransferase n=1 Tax=Streptomyces sp. NPDC047082 TaxID=3155259 RepID=UPI00340B9E50
MTPDRENSSVAPFHVCEYADTAAVDFLTQDWPRLFERDASATVYQDPYWLLAWARQLPASCEPLIVAVCGPAGPVSALALVREACRGGGTRIFPLSWPASEQVLPLGATQQTADLLVTKASELAASGCQVTIADLPSDSAFGRQAELQWGRPGVESLYATVPLPLDIAALSRSTRRDHQRRRRIVQELGGRVGYVRTRTTGELLQAYRTLEDLHALRNRDRPAAALASDLSLPWPQVLRQCASLAFVATLTVDGEAVAAQLCLQWNGRAHSVVTAMDPAHHQLSPGHLLLELLCDDLAREGYVALELGRTVSDSGQRAYKSSYGAVWTLTRTYSVHSNMSDCTEDFSSAGKISVTAA